MDKYFIVFDDSNVLQGRLIEGRNVIPVGAVEVTFELWCQTINEQDGLWMLDPDGQITKHPFPPPTPEEILSINQGQQAILLSQASIAMAPILVSLQLGDATDDETVIAKAWQGYYRDLKAVDMTVESPEWPVSPNQV